MRSMRPRFFPIRRFRRVGLCLALLCVSLLLSGCGLKVLDFGWDEAGSDTGLRVARTAQTQIGKRYRSGGTSPGTGFDCSGLIWWAYRQHGVTVPRVTTDQARAGSGVGRQQARAGDILVFRTSSGAAGLHTGLYTGNGGFVHSPSSGKRIRMDAIHDAYWSRRLIGVRRIVR